MEVFLYNSTVCRLCGEENDSGTLLYSCEENNQNLSDLINTYLPIKVSDDGQLPRTICPGCTIQLEATVEFLNLIINGQKVIRELHQREKEYKKTVLSGANESEVITENIVYEINTSDGVYQVEHPIALQVSGLARPRRKRGRPPKKPKSPEEVAEETAAKENELEAKKQTNEGEVTGKRRRKTPTRFKEAVQGKELERIFKEEGVIDGDESEAETKPDIDAEAAAPTREPEVIGHMETSGELVVVVKGKGRGRPKGRMRPTREECAICGMEFSCVGRYMSHVAQHGPVQYRCECGHAGTRLQHTQHQRDTGHQTYTVVPRADTDPDQPAETPALPVTDSNTSLEMKSLPRLIPDDSPVKEDSRQIEFVNLDAVKKDEPDGETNPVVECKVENPLEVPPEHSDTTERKVKERLKCNHCEKTFNSKQSKSLHIKAVHQGEKPYACSECGCRFAYPRSLALHALSHRRHRAAQRYACDLCGKVLNHPSSVVYHKEAEHAGQRYVCNKCGKCFKHKQLLQRHQLVHSQLRPYSCKTCNASFKTKANLLNHQLLHSGIKKFSCEICKHKFAHKTSLTLHMRWHTGSKPFACKVCNKSFSQKGNLSEHERIHTGEKPYQCSICPRRFTTSSQYRLHAKRHQPDRPYACSHCPKRFVSRGSWLAHQRRAAGAGAGGLRAHACAVCARSFAERWALLKHMRRHTGERPFRCPHCPRTFADCSNLNKHKKQVHKQISLLVNNDQNQQQVVEQPQLQQQQIQQIQLQESSQDALSVTEVPSEGDELEERVIYVTYDVEDNEPAYHIIDPEQAAAIEEDESKVITTCSLLNGGSLLMPGAAIGGAAVGSLPVGAGALPVPARSLPVAAGALTARAGAQPVRAGALPVAATALPMPEPLVIAPAEQQIAVTDEQGNPLHFTMADGTRLAITSADGRSLQVVTADGRAIPVEINEFDGDEEAEEEAAEETVVHQIDFQKTVDSNVSSPVTHYFTIV